MVRSMTNTANTANGTNGATPSTASSALAPEVLTVPEFATALRVSAPTVRNWIANGTIVSVGAGRQHRIPRSELDRLLKPRGVR